MVFRTLGEMFCFCFCFFAFVFLFLFCFVFLFCFAFLCCFVLFVFQIFAESDVLFGRHFETVQIFNFDFNFYSLILYIFSWNMVVFSVHRPIYGVQIITKLRWKLDTRNDQSVLLP